MQLKLIHIVDDLVRVEWGHVVLLDYHYRTNVPREETPKPYIHPLTTPNGDLFTLDRPHDHAWHRGLFFGWAWVNAVNLWGGASYVRGQGYTLLDDHGEIVHMRWEGLERHNDRVTAVESLLWRDQNGREMATERRTLTVYVPESETALLLTVASEVQPSEGMERLEFSTPMIEGRPDPSGYSGLTIRMPRSMTGGDMLDATGARGDAVMGSRAQWAMYRAMQDGTCRPCAVAMFDHPQNPRYPTHWFVRNTPFAVLSPALVWDERFVLSAGQKLKLLYGVWLRSGEVTAHQVQQAYDDWLARCSQQEV